MWAKKSPDSDLKATGLDMRWLFMFENEIFSRKKIRFAGFYSPVSHTKDLFTDGETQNKRIKRFVLVFSG
jgi:hypothetical protein